LLGFFATIVFIVLGLAKFCIDDLENMSDFIPLGRLSPSPVCTQEVEIGDGQLESPLHSFDSSVPFLYSCGCYHLLMLEI